jgi:hypothetical protein
MAKCVDTVRTVWVSEEEKIISFHAVDGYVSIDFDRYTSFVAFILYMGEQRFRFQ